MDCTPQTLTEARAAGNKPFHGSGIVARPSHRLQDSRAFRQHCFTNERDPITLEHVTKLTHPYIVTQNCGIYCFDLCSLAKLLFVNPVNILTYKPFTEELILQHAGELSAIIARKNHLAKNPFNLSYTNLPYSLGEQELLAFVKECCTKLQQILQQTDTLYLYDLLRLFKEICNGCYDRIERCHNFRCIHPLTREICKLRDYILSIFTIE